MRRVFFTRLITIGFLASACLLAADPFFLRRELAEVKPRPDDLTAQSQGRVL